MGRSNPLEGRRIVVTRPRQQADELVRMLEGAGATVLLAPMIRVEPLMDEPGIAVTVDELDRYDWLVFTSVNGVRSFLPSALQLGPLPNKLRICAIGEATADQVRAAGAVVDLIPEDYVAESVVAALRVNTDLAGKRILLARAQDARQILPEALRESGAEVTDLPVYRTVPEAAAAASLKQELESSPADLIVFTSSSTVRNFRDLVASDPGSAQIASIGPITSETIRSFGWKVNVEAGVYTAQGLLEAITAHYLREDV
jgi:uroporphyrinogen III methyltransferase/synthase